MATTYSKSAVARAVIVSRLSSTFSAESVLIAAPATTIPFTPSSFLGEKETLAGNIVPGSMPYLIFTADSVLKKLDTIIPFSADSLIVSPTKAYNFSADSVISVASGNWLDAIPDTATATVGIILSMSNTNVTSMTLERENPETLEWKVIETTTYRNLFVTDYSAPFRTEFRYRGRGYNSSGMLIESTTTYPITLDIDSWAISVESLGSLFINVTASSAEKELQTETFSPLGSTFKTVQTGLSLGRKGTITLFVGKDDRQSTIEAIETYINSTDVSYLRSPFGLSMAVAFGAVGEKFIEGGNSEVTIEYVENGDT